MSSAVATAAAALASGLLQPPDLLRSSEQAAVSGAASPGQRGVFMPCGQRLCQTTVSEVHAAGMWQSKCSRDLQGGSRTCQPTVSRLWRLETSRRPDSFCFGPASANSILKLPFFLHAGPCHSPSWYPCTGRQESLAGFSISKIESLAAPWSLKANQWIPSLLRLRRFRVHVLMFNHLRICMNGFLPAFRRHHEAARYASRHWFR